MYLLDTNALIILMYGEVTSIKLSEETISIINSSEHLCIRRQRMSAYQRFSLPKCLCINILKG